eukprot:CAMPEP_0194449040 /NCGR_PEP_ID=MMETSP0176-20130528/129907_1 /TAXON_ID=216777 /ORGANISM="Proboscia alata, Strain PI-D3" /LENGTH=327 /DNA_ID=CAMNT_0039276095 /DNA_START=2789 /DNA_END=3772 /DNA_ORIENTATION=-
MSSNPNSASSATTTCTETHVEDPSSDNDDKGNAGAGRITTTTTVHRQSYILATGARDGFVKLWKIIITSVTVTVVEEVEESSSFLESSVSSTVEIEECDKFEPCAKEGKKKTEPITAVAFAPTLISPHQLSSGPEAIYREEAILAVGMESGFMELWSIDVSDMSLLSSELGSSSDCNGLSSNNSSTAALPSTSTSGKNPNSPVKTRGTTKIRHDGGGRGDHKRGSSAGMSTTNSKTFCRPLLSFRKTDCHIDAVKKLAWRPMLPSSSALLLPTFGSTGGSFINTIDTAGQCTSNDANLSLVSTRTMFTLASCSLDHGVRLFDIIIQH